MKYNFNTILTSLKSAISDDFRGFLCEGVERIKIPDDLYHIQVAYEEMKKIPGWTYTSGVGQNPLIEYLDQKKAIYITKIPLSDTPGKFQRTVGYLTDSYSEITQYQGVEMKEYEVLKRIALDMGYDVDEYTLEDPETSNIKTPASIKIYTSSNTPKISSQFNAKRSLKEGDQPVFSSTGDLMGFFSNGKFVSKNKFPRYSSNDDLER